MIFCNAAARWLSDHSSGVSGSSFTSGDLSSFSTFTPDPAESATSSVLIVSTVNWVMVSPVMGSPVPVLEITDRTPGGPRRPGSMNPRGRASVLPVACAVEPFRQR